MFDAREAEIFGNFDYKAEPEDAMCIWEAVVVFETSAFAKQKKGVELSPIEKVIQDWHGDVGAAEMRSTVTVWIPILNLAWRVANEVYDYEDCFDYEFCPWFIRHCIHHESMTVREDWLQQVRKIHEIQKQELMEREGWGISNQGYLTGGYDAWRVVIEKAIKNRNPVHRQALRALSPREFEKLSIFCYAAFTVNLKEELDAHPW